MNKWPVLFVVLLLVIGVIVISTSDKGPNENEPVSTGRPERIISLAPNLTEILFALGLEERIAGVTNRSNYPAEAKAKPKMGTFWQPNIEAVIAAEPDLVITLGFDQQKKLAEQLKRIGCNILTVNIEKISELFEAIEKIGAAAGVKSCAEELIGNIKNDLERISDLAPKDKTIKVLWVIQREPLRVAGRDTFINELIETAGGKNAIGETIHQYPPIGAEQVIASGADVIIESAMNKNDLDRQQKDAVEFWSKFRTVAAVKNSRVYVIDPDPVTRLGPRLSEGAETIAKCIQE